MNDSKAKVLAEIMVRNKVTPRRPRQEKEQPPTEPKTRAELKAGDTIPAVPTIDEIIVDEPRYNVALTTLEMRALRHVRKIRTAKLSIAVSHQEKDQILAYCKRQGFPSASHWLRGLAFRAMGKPIPPRSPKSKNRD